MRLVRFHLEPWQKGGSLNSTPCGSPTLMKISASVHRRQRSVDIDDISNIETVSESVRIRKLRNKHKWRYPQVVKKLSILCSDVFARNVSAK